jgi:hypothetical protein
MRPHRQPFFSSDGVVEEEPTTPAISAPRVPRAPDEPLHPMTCLIACLALLALLWSSIYEAYRLVRWLLS